MRGRNVKHNMAGPPKQEWSPSKGRENTIAKQRAKESPVQTTGRVRERSYGARARRGSVESPQKRGRGEREERKKRNGDKRRPIENKQEGVF